MEREIDHILIENGDVFDGTREQFRNCFFDNANDTEIIDWCRTLGFSQLSINKNEIFNP